MCMVRSLASIAPDRVVLGIRVNSKLRPHRARQAMERLRRSFTFSGRSKRRQAEEERKKSASDHKNEENGVENPEAGRATGSGGDKAGDTEVRNNTIEDRAALEQHNDVC